MAEERPTRSPHFVTTASLSLLPLLPMLCKRQNRVRQSFVMQSEPNSASFAKSSGQTGCSISRKARLMEWTNGPLFSCVLKMVSGSSSNKRHAGGSCRNHRPRPDLVGIRRAQRASRADGRDRTTPQAIAAPSSTSLRVMALQTCCCGRDLRSWQRFSWGLETDCQDARHGQPVDADPQLIVFAIVAHMRRQVPSPRASVAQTGRSPHASQILWRVMFSTRYVGFLDVVFEQATAAF